MSESKFTSSELPRDIPENNMKRSIMLEKKENFIPSQAKKKKTNVFQPGSMSNTQLSGNLAPNPLAVLFSRNEAINPKDIATGLKKIYQR
jgi:hypothetical protein